MLGCQSLECESCDSAINISAVEMLPNCISSVMLVRVLGPLEGSFVGFCATVLWKLHASQVTVHQLYFDIC